VGVPRSLYAHIWDNIVEYNGDWEGYDVVLRKLEDDPWYQSFHSIDDAKKIQEEAKKYIVQGPLTDEERGWERYNIDQLFQVTNHLKIFNRIGGYFKLIDKFFDTKFYDELKEQAEIDKKKFEEERKNNPQKNEEGDHVHQGGAAPAAATPEPAPAEQAAAPVRETAPQRAVRETAPEAPPAMDWNGLLDGSFNGTKYLGVAGMTDDEKKMVIGIDEKTHQFLYVKTWNGNPVQLYECKENHFMSPGEFHLDPLSGALF
jgi:hypothetical protein